MEITAEGLNRATLARQLLLARSPLPVADAIARVAGLQAQEPASPYVGLWNRVEGFEPADLDSAFLAHDVVKATVMRATLHAVPVGDFADLRTAMRPVLRAMALHDRRYTDTGLTKDDADALIPEVVAFAAQARTGPEIAAMLDARTGVVDAPPPGLFRAFRLVAPFVHAPTGGPWSFGPRPSFLASPVPESGDDPAACLGRLAARYLAAFGPASAQDFARFTMHPVPAARAAIASVAEVADVVDLVGPGGKVLHDVRDAPRPDDDEHAPARLLGMWDNLLLAHADRTRVISDEHRKLVIRTNGDTLPTVLVDGRVAGVWSVVDGQVEVSAFRTLPTQAWDELAVEAAGLLAMVLPRDPNLYRRCRHWFAGLPAVEVRSIGT